MFRILSCSVCLLLLVGCKDRQATSSFDEGETTMQLTCTAFREGETIPKKYTGDGDDVSPPLRWSDAPQGTASFALVCDDPDAPRAMPWVHWVIYNLPADARELPEATPKQDSFPTGVRQGKNDFGNAGYGGPAPPRGKPHRYYFKLYALDRVLDLTAGATKQQLEQAMKGHVLGRGELMGKYGR
jgi:Raf kinase inhibitor-like YbhB/YbcL family protein